MEPNRNRAFVILPSKDQYMHARIKSGIYYYYLPKEQYEEYQRKYGVMDSRLLEEPAEARARREAQERREYDIETEKVIDLIDISNRRNHNGRKDIIDIEAYEVRPTERKTSRPTAKRNIRNKPVQTKKKRYKGSKDERLKACFAAILIVLSMMLSVMGFEKYVDYSDRYNETAAAVESLDENEIRGSIEDILKREISSATGAELEDIDISQYVMGSSFERTEVEAGDATYRYDRDLRSPFNWGNTLKSGGLRSIIDAVNDAKGDRKALIKALMKARKFSEEKDLIVDGDKLKEVDAPTNDGNER